MGPGLYIHVPFCARRCPYCDFYAEVVDGETRSRTVAAILREAELRLPLWVGGTFDSVFLGGGTPSLLGPHLLGNLARGLRERLPVADGAEWTVEANPDSAGAAFLETARGCGFNRLSLGVQSFCDEELMDLGRLHDRSGALAAVAAARRAGWGNMNVDLIYGLPGSQSGRRWRQSLETAVSLSVEHLSCYLLTLEPGVAMERSVREGTLTMPGDGAVRQQYEEARQLLNDAGYEHYEISNWARPGFRCRHNENVWTGGEYLALGPAAHGHQKGVRWANRSDLASYLRSLADGNLPSCEEEEIDPDRRAAERILLGLRLRDGLSWEDLRLEFGVDWVRQLKNRAACWTRRGMIEDDGSRLRLSGEGLFVSNRLIAELLAAS